MQASSRVFKGPKHYFRTFFLFMIVLFLFISVGFLYTSFNTNTFEIGMFVIFEFILIFIYVGLVLLVYKIEKKEGIYELDAYRLIIGDNYIESKELNVHKRVEANNIKKIKFERTVGGTGSRIFIWPKDYGILRENGFELNKQWSDEYRKKHNIAVIIYPPSLKREERKRLKEAIEEFKKRHGIE